MCLFSSKVNDCNNTTAFQGTFADAFMWHLEKKFLTYEAHCPIFFERSVDDIVMPFSSGYDIDGFYNCFFFVSK